MAETTLNPHTEKWAHLKPNQYCRLQKYSEGFQVWRTPCGNPHRVDESGIQDGPAVIYPDGRQAWLLNGDLHRLDGPAGIYSHGHQRYYLDGTELTQEQWSQDPRVIDFLRRKFEQNREESEQWLKSL